MKKRQKRKYLVFLEKSLNAIEASISAFNQVSGKHRIESALILMVNAWELLCKGVLIKKRGSYQAIVRDKLGNTISANEAVLAIKNASLIGHNEEDNIQQIISLRDYATHDILPAIPDELLHHLFYFSCMSFKKLIEKEFPSYKHEMDRNYLSISLSKMTTYAEKVQQILTKRKKDKNGESTLIWLLERGVRFDGAPYISKERFELSLKGKKKIIPYLELGKFMKESEMVRVIAVTAPKNYSVDVHLRKGDKKISDLPVYYKKTVIENDYPHRTEHLIAKLGKGRNMILGAIKSLNLKGDSTYHQSVESGKNSFVHRYSDVALDKLGKFFQENPNYSPFGKSASTPLGTQQSTE